ncbi:hypothetical protein HHK36_022840 [Tetracentron sinense]|uniref:protein-serine/threonine phosphatase n=1 Tax=Tetracentron sinense TaxID=13715 RepID=A0A834YTZ0_TETSI|nr:hypothetical protein HHK36_022840 [Tetracentron sinense]
MFCCCFRPSSDEDTQDFQEVPPHENGNSLQFASVPSHNFHLEYSVVTQRGYYPDETERKNQDSFCIRTQIKGNSNLHFFGVFDGHGEFGTDCSKFVSDRLVENLSNDPTLLEDPVKAYYSACLATNSELNKSQIEDSDSGTTAITVLVSGDTLYVANVGDSRAVLAVKSGNSVIAEDLSYDHKPIRKDEYERVKLCGATVLSNDQVDGLKDHDIQTWSVEDGDPPRLWAQTGMGEKISVAFTRSFGDRSVEEIGVIAVPEVQMVRLTPNHPFFVVASDGVFDFLSSQDVVDMVARYTDPRDACAAIAKESTRKWLEHQIQTRTDDITIIIVHIKDLSNV